MRLLTGWGYIFRDDTGKLVSEATRIADPLPAGLSLFERPDRIDNAVERWDIVSRTIVGWTDDARAGVLDMQAAALTAEAVRLRAGAP